MKDACKSDLFSTAEKKTVIVLNLKPYISLDLYECWMKQKMQENNDFLNKLLCFIPANSHLTM